MNMNICNFMIQILNKNTLNKILAGPYLLSIHKLYLTIILKLNSFLSRIIKLLVC